MWRRLFFFLQLLGFVSAAQLPGTDVKISYTTIFYVFTLLLFYHCDDDIFKICRAFRQFISLHVSFLSRAQTNWLVPNLYGALWVFKAQIVDHCSALTQKSVEVKKFCRVYLPLPKLQLQLRQSYLI